MIRELVIFCAVFLCVESKIYSRDLEIVKQQSSSKLQWRTGKDLTRMRRSPGGQSDHAPLPADITNATIQTSEFSLQGETHHEVFVSWTGEKNETILILTRDTGYEGILNSTLWRSGDRGTTYSKVNLPESCLISHIYSSSGSRSQTILSDVSHKRLYVTRDAGGTWTTVQLDFAPNRMVVHPTRKDYVLAFSLQKMSLYSSKDFGTTWTFLREMVTERFFWAVPGVDADDLTVHMEVQDSTGPVSYMACVVPNCTPAKFDNSLGNIDFFSLVVQDNYVFVQKSTGDSSDLYVSYRRGPFKRAFFPLDLHAVDVNIVETSEDQVFLVVDHEEDVANLYMSDITGQFYVTSMENVVGLRFPGKFDVDIVKVKGFKGIYLLNKFMVHRNKGGVYQQKTFITFNKGGNWSEVQPPDSRHCNGSCSLNFHLGNTNSFYNIPFVKVDEQAPGLIIAHGSVGEFIDLDINVFISRDAGHTWIQAPFTGNFHLNILNQGSAIVAIDADFPTSQLHFSWTEGASWQTYNFTDDVMMVHGLLNQPGIKTLISSVFGHSDVVVGWSIIKLNFSSILQRECEDSDFEQWYPSSVPQAGGQNCVLGEHSLFERRKQMTRCYLGNSYMRPKSIQPCLCTREDFECDYGYDLSDDDFTCTPADWFSATMLPQPHCVDGKFNQTIGYRRIPGDSCYGGVEKQYSSKLTDCPIIAPKGLEITAAQSYIATERNVTFRLKQNYGSEQDTDYTWTFGDGSPSVTIHGLQESSVMVHRFSKSGTFNVSVKASNSKGTTSASVTVHLEDSIVGVLVEIPWGASTRLPSFFNVTVLGFHNKTKKHGNLHFAWVFENKESGHIHQLRQLSWQSAIQQKFDKPGEYLLTLEVFNPVSSIVYSQSIDVYDDITTVRLHFSKEINLYNTSNLNVRQALAEILCYNLAQILEVRRTRIIMTVQPYSPIVGDLSVLPARPNSSEASTRFVVEMLIEEAKHQTLGFPLFTDNDIVVITDAHILNLTSGEEEDKADVLTPTEPAISNVSESVPVTNTSNTSAVEPEMVQGSRSRIVYIVVPVALGSVVLLTLCIIAFRKKICDLKRYSLILRRSEEDSLDDDDDRPVEVATDFRSIYSSNNQPDQNHEVEPSLVLVCSSQTSVDSQRLIEDC